MKYEKTIITLMLPIIIILTVCYIMWINPVSAMISFYKIADGIFLRFATLVWAGVLLYYISDDAERNKKQDNPSG